MKAPKLTELQVAKIVDELPLERLWVDKQESTMPIIDSGNYWVTRDVTAIVNAALASQAAQPVSVDTAADNGKRLAWIHCNMTGTTIRGTVINVLADHVNYESFIAAIDAAIAAQKDK